MDAARLKEIERRAEKATPGPWEAERDGWVHYIVAELDRRYAVLQAIEPETALEANVLFAAHARQDIPFLLSRIAALEAAGEALESMVWQFAYRVTKGGKPALSDGGLSALEETFAALGWEDPHYVDETVTCDVEGCNNWYSPQIKWDGVYSLICEEHFSDRLAGKPRPHMKARAIQREAMRDENGRLPVGWESALRPAPEGAEGE